MKALGLDPDKSQGENDGIPTNIFGTLRGISICASEHDAKLSPRRSRRRLTALIQKPKPQKIQYEFRLFVKTSVLGYSLHQSKVNHMPYMSVLQCRIADLSSWTETWNEWGKDFSLSTGATGARMSQTMLGGEQAGIVMISFDWDSIDTAMSGLTAMNNEERVVSAFKAAGVVPQGRSLMQIDQERGVPEGSYFSAIMMTGSPIPPSGPGKRYGPQLWDSFKLLGHWHEINAGRGRWRNDWILLERHLHQFVRPADGRKQRGIL